MNPRYNIAPTQSVPVIRQHPKEPVRELSLVRWGLIPSWARDSSVTAQMINAWSETAATKPAEASTPPPGAPSAGRELRKQYLDTSVTRFVPTASWSRSGGRGRSGSRGRDRDRRGGRSGSRRSYRTTIGKFSTDRETQVLTYSF